MARWQGVLKNYGFDDATTPPWVMVPLNGFKAIQLVDGKDLVLTTNNAAAAKIDKDVLLKSGVRDIVVKNCGLKAPAFIEARTKAGGLVLRLEVGVKALKTIKVTFHYVEDNAGHKTTRTAGDADKLLDAMNVIYLPQANIKFIKNATKPLKIAQNLGKVVRFSSHLPNVPKAQHEWDIVVKNADATADYNVFCVWEYEQDATPLHDDADAGTIGSNTLYEDNLGQADGEVLAHEAGHFLGVGDTYAATDTNLLMFGNSNPGGTKIPKAHANTFNNL